MCNGTAKTIHQHAPAMPNSSMRGIGAGVVERWQTVQHAQRDLLYLHRAAASTSRSSNGNAASAKGADAIADELVDRFALLS